MENYLLELIRENNRIIIPNFGAFIVSREKEQNILFNSFLSFNDGLLISHICAVEGVDSATAARKVDNYVAQVNSTLDEKGFYEIEGIGRFTKGDNGVLRFEQATSDVSDLNHHPDTAGSAFLKTDEESDSDDGDLLDLDTSGVEEVPLKKTPSTQENNDLLQSDDRPAYTSGSFKAATPLVPEEDQSSEAGSEPRDVEKVIYVKKKKAEEPLGLYFLVVLILLLLVGSTLWFFTDVFDDFKSRNKPQPIKTEKVEVSESPDETSPEEELGRVEEEVTEETVVVSTRQHHVIVGSFREESKAQEQMKSLADKGYETASILPYEGRYLLSVEWYPSVNKALQRQEELLQELQMENWVLSLTVK